MKKIKSLWLVVFPVLFTTSIYVVFYSRIESKPNHAGFWFIFIMGMSLGISLTRFIEGVKSKKTENE